MRCALHAGGDTGRLKDRKGTGSGDSYKVLLLDDPRHTEKHGMYPLLFSFSSIGSGGAYFLTTVCVRALLCSGDGVAAGCSVRDRGGGAAALPRVTPERRRARHRRRQGTCTHARTTFI